MHYAVHARILFQYLAVDAPFFVSLRDALSGTSWLASSLYVVTELISNLDPASLSETETRWIV